ncbi:MAG: OmpH family outer membrane protein [Bacteroidia bacterium]|nr:OmpH family outer membrane protein [Bacteroidia bacterium]NND24390.1 OmpH family outer membrane protein [Flavobacteriaceae bacterium]MBT8279786.1 OmpH family outer membrane protein [Bacteroidia bacterium]NNK59871.1 OmpH family outer membrane protein [Flavobacteriaceae bacterium]NNL31754.1 OmpH family outer membrane protein [Flavobacteriaceae bacterium]
MKTKVLFLLALTSFLTYSSFAQRSIRIGYIDTEYILENVPEYQDATAQLDAKVMKWKNEIEQRLTQIETKKEQLNNESVLLTKELIEERQEEIDIEQNEVLDYQQKRFGPNGDLIIQKKQLMQPVQDQIFSAVQEIAANKNYDFVFDKSADLTMLYSAERFDISEQVLRSITRSSKRRQATTKQERKAAEKEEIIPEVNPEKDARAQALEDKKMARQLEIEEKRKAQTEAREAKKREIEAKRQKILEDRAKAREEKLKEREKDSEAGKTAEPIKEGTKKTDSTAAKKVDDKTKSAVDKAKEKASKKLSDREARKKALEDKKKKIIEAREKARKEKLEGKKKTDSTEAKKDNDN